MARRNNATPPAPEPDNATDHIDFNDPETDNHHEGGGEVQDPEAEPQDHSDKHEDDGKPDAPEGANTAATDEVLDTHEGAEPEKVYDHEAAAQDTDNTHQDGNNGLHQEDYVDADTAAELGRQEAIEYSQHGAADDTGLHPGDIGRRLNLSNEGLVHSTLAPANRDETIVGDHPETEKGLRPLAPLDGQVRTDDAGRPYDGDKLHTVEKGLPVGMGVLEHIHAPTATGSVPEGILSARAPVPVSGHERDPKRIEAREGLSKLDAMLGEAEHRLLDIAEDMRVKGAATFLLAQVGASVTTAETLVKAGLLKAEEAMGGGFFPKGGSIYSLTY